MSYTKLNINEDEKIVINNGLVIDSTTIDILRNIRDFFDPIETSLEESHYKMRKLCSTLRTAFEDYTKNEYG